MARRPKPEEIVSKLRQVDVLVSQGKTVGYSVRSIGVTEVTYYRWRKEFGGLKLDQVKRLKELETENMRLRKAIADLTLDKLRSPRVPDAPLGRTAASFERTHQQAFCKGRFHRIQERANFRTDQPSRTLKRPYLGRRAIQAPPEEQPAGRNIVGDEQPR